MDAPSGPTLGPYRRIGDLLGQGSSAIVFKAISNTSGGVIAYKKSRVSLRVRRTILRHEARVMLLLQGHPAIPLLVGYHRVPHFEYLGMELLGKSLKSMIEPGHALKQGTVARIGAQMVSAFEHLYKLGFVHRDVKPSNILLCSSNPAHVRLVDFGIARHIGRDVATTPKKMYDSVKDNKFILGTLNFCSLNSHAGYELRPRDDLESLAYTLFFLLLGSMPWKDYAWREGEPSRHAMVRIEAAKRKLNDILPISGPPVKFSDLLRLARTPQSPSTDFASTLASTREMLNDLATSLGAHHDAPLDCTLVPAPTPALDVESDTDTSSYPDDKDEQWSGYDLSNEEYASSYCGVDFECWDNIQCGRDKDLTFLADDVELLDGQIPDMGGILGDLVKHF